MPPTAILYDNDVMAVAALGVAAELGVAVPQDVSLLAWDDSQLCRITRPTLTAMSRDVVELGPDHRGPKLVGVIAGAPAGITRGPHRTDRGPGQHRSATRALSKWFDRARPAARWVA